MPTSSITKDFVVKDPKAYLNLLQEIEDKEAEVKKKQKPKESMFQLARMILRDECPPDNRMYLCKMGDCEECDCIECWDKYLLWAVNGYRGNPYERDRYSDINW